MGKKRCKMNLKSCYSAANADYDDVIQRFRSEVE